MLLLLHWTNWATRYTGCPGPTGATGPAGATGQVGPTGEAATITIGNVITGEPGTNAKVVNSGNLNRAVFDFVIPRGEPGGEGTINILATVDTTNQASKNGGAITFNATPLVSGSAISHKTQALLISKLTNLVSIRHLFIVMFPWGQKLLFRAM